ncbi:MAG TPA: serine/threonine-protein kinase [Acidimicrobiales bacterium]|nr:serine/threonine-protein kinase [Acidimicrobiales bacterium]
MDAQPHTPPETAAAPAKARLAGRYELGEPLGKGRSTVYRATDMRLQRPVAVKQVELAAGQEDAERVRTRAVREAQAAARLNNPSVVTVYDVVEEDGSIWLVMELVEAPSLAQIVAEGGPLSHSRAAHVGLDVLAALEAAHAVGIVHRDVKPANVLVSSSDRAKLTDFGVATIRDDSRLTATGLIVGSPSYMSPEQARGDLVGPATDLWALGALLYFATEGEPPFQGDSALATASAVVHGAPRLVHNAGPLTVIMSRLLTKDPGNRATPSEVRAALNRAARSGGGARAGAASGTTAVILASRPDVPAAAATPRSGWPARSRLLLLVGAALVLLLGVAAVGALTRDDGGGNGAAAPPATTEASNESATTPTTAEPEATTSTTAPATSTTAPAAAAGVPAGWTAYEDPRGRFRIAYPTSWEVVPAGPSLTDFRDPATGAKLRVDWTDTPGADPAQAWRDLAAGFARNHDNYQELGIAPTTYRDYNAALWEFSYGSSPPIHAANLGFVTGGRGYALLFTAPEDQWAAQQGTAEQFRQAFQPVPR